MEHKRPIRSLLMAVLMAMLFVLLVPALAQDSTAEPSPVPASTVEAPVIINVEAPATVEATVNPDEPWYIKWLAAGSAFLVSVGLLFRAFNKWLETTKTNASRMTIGEQVFSRLPGPLKGAIVSLIKEFIRLGGNLDEIIAELGDDVPYVVKAQKPPSSTPPDLPSTGAATTWPSSPKP